MENPLVQKSEVKKKAWVLQYWPKQGMVSPVEEKIFLLPAFTLEEARGIAEEHSFPIAGMDRGEYVIVKTLSIDYDLLFPELAKEAEARLDVGKLNELIEYRGYQKHEIDGMINRFEEVDGTKRFIMGLRLMLDRADPTKQERAAVERLITKLEIRYGRKDAKSADQ